MLRFRHEGARAAQRPPVSRQPSQWALLTQVIKDMGSAELVKTGREASQF